MWKDRGGEHRSVRLHCKLYNEPVGLAVSHCPTTVPMLQLKSVEWKAAELEARSSIQNLKLKVPVSM